MSVFSNRRVTQTFEGIVTGESEYAEAIRLAKNGRQVWDELAGLNLLADKVTLDRG